MNSTQTAPEAPPAQRFTPRELEAVGGLTAIFALRMLGFYLVLPVFAPYVSRLPGSTPLLVGLAVGAYGLMQTVLQVPFGSWSDKVGRKPVIAFGLLLFGAGSVVCAMAQTAPVLVAGRVLQGCGALASVAVAMVADLTRDSVRTKAMAMIGMAIGVTFTLGLMVGPVAAATIGIPSLFWLTAALCVVALLFLWLRIPEAPKISHHDDVEFSKEYAKEVLGNRQLLILDWGTFNLHVALTCLFVTGPFLLERIIPHQDYWKIFLPILAAGLLVLGGGAQISGRPGWGKPTALLGKGLIAAALMVLALTVPGTVYGETMGLPGLLTGIALFVAGFALLEPLYPALLTSACQQATRGTAVGIFNMSQFSGAFVGGLVSGFFMESNLATMYWVLCGASILWILAARKMKSPAHMTVVGIPLVSCTREERRRTAQRLMSLRGVQDVAWEREKEQLLVRFNPQHIPLKAVQSVVEAPKAD